MFVGVVALTGPGRERSRLNGLEFRDTAGNVFGARGIDSDQVAKAP
ncbi:MAG: hypothetical protein ACI91J_000440 [Yoonia sp.]|jgi:hypothetical protein